MNRNTEEAVIQLLETVEEALEVHPHLAMELGYTRPTDWMVHVWDSRGVGLQDAPKVVTTHGSLEHACLAATNELRRYVGI